MNSLFTIIGNAQCSIEKIGFCLHALEFVFLTTAFRSIFNETSVLILDKLREETKQDNKIEENEFKLNKGIQIPIPFLQSSVRHIIIFEYAMKPRKIRSFDDDNDNYHAFSKHLFGYNDEDPSLFSETPLYFVGNQSTFPDIRDNMKHRIRLHSKMISEISETLHSFVIDLQGPLATKQLSEKELIERGASFNRKTKKWYIETNDMEFHGLARFYDISPFSESIRVLAYADEKKLFHNFDLFTKETARDEDTSSSMFQIFAGNYPQFVREGGIMVVRVTCPCFLLYLATKSECSMGPAPIRDLLMKHDFSWNYLASLFWAMHHNVNSQISTEGLPWNLFGDNDVLSLDRYAEKLYDLFFSWSTFHLRTIITGTTTLRDVYDKNISHYLGGILLHSSYYRQVFIDGKSKIKFRKAWARGFEVIIADEFLQIGATNTVDSDNNSDNNSDYFDHQLEWKAMNDSLDFSNKHQKPKNKYCSREFYKRFLNSWNFGIHSWEPTYSDFRSLLLKGIQKDRTKTMLLNLYEKRIERKEFRDSFWIPMSSFDIAFFEKTNSPIDNGGLKYNDTAFNGILNYLNMKNVNSNQNFANHDIVEGNLFHFRRYNCNLLLIYISVEISRIRELIYYLLFIHNRIEMAKYQQDKRHNLIRMCRRQSGIALCSSHFWDVRCIPFGISDSHHYNNNHNHHHSHSHNWLQGKPKAHFVELRPISVATNSSDCWYPTWPLCLERKMVGPVYNSIMMTTNIISSLGHVESKVEFPCTCSFQRKQMVSDRNILESRRIYDDSISLVDVQKPLFPFLRVYKKKSVFRMLQNFTEKQPDRLKDVYRNILQRIDKIFDENRMVISSQAEFVENFWNLLGPTRDLATFWIKVPTNICPDHCLDIEPYSCDVEVKRYRETVPFQYFFLAFSSSTIMYNGIDYEFGNNLYSTVKTTETMSLFNPL